MSLKFLRRCMDAFLHCSRYFSVLVIVGKFKNDFPKISKNLDIRLPRFLSRKPFSQNGSRISPLKKIELTSFGSLDLFLIKNSKGGCSLILMRQFLYTPKLLFG